MSAPVRAASSSDLRLGFWRWEGDFGSTEDNALQSIVAEMAFNGAANRFTVSVPWSSIDNAGNVLMTPEGPAVVGIGGPGKPSFQQDAAGSSASGVGDILVRQDTFLTKAGRGNRPALSFFLDYKFATADQRQGLGTGEDDWGGGLTYIQPAGKSVQFLGDAAYRSTGDPDGIEFNDRLRFGLGIAIVRRGAVWRLYAENVDPILDVVPVYDGFGAPIGTAASEDYRHVRLELAYRTNKGGTVRLGVSTGLTDASEDIGFVVVLSSGSPW